MWGSEAANLFIKSLPDAAIVLDIGAGSDGGGFGNLLRESGHKYVPFDIASGQDWENASIQRMYAARGQVYDGVYMCHCLEHLLNIQSSLQAIKNVLKEKGILGITVPPRKDQIVGGHVSLWNAGLLLYRLILAGFDCRDAAVKSYGYNCSVVIRNKNIDQLPRLKRDSGDIARLSKYFPKPFTDGFDGNIQEINWRLV